jgi:hypothetical protein
MTLHACRYYFEKDNGDLCEPVRGCDDAAGDVRGPDGQEAEQTQPTHRHNSFRTGKDHCCQLLANYSGQMTRKIRLLGKKFGCTHYLF